eukprot:TRINITY_DN35750_c0_g1_i1.p1 TRINITY_DN35750_c0_g1~~TRINITY_DN35750_c0_g1_i1.p1  ORF type:complete len:534 (+),score=93.43 TRINITY_DN35750_c0_g1_i1:136-1737(+)
MVIEGQTKDGKLLRSGGAGAKTPRKHWAARYCTEYNREASEKEVPFDPQAVSDEDDEGLKKVKELFAAASPAVKAAVAFAASAFRSRRSLLTVPGSSADDTLKGIEDKEERAFLLAKKYAAIWRARCAAKRTSPVVKAAEDAPRDSSVEVSSPEPAKANAGNRLPDLRSRNHLSLGIQQRRCSYATTTSQETPTATPVRRNGRRRNSMRRDSSGCLSPRSYRSDGSSMDMRQWPTRWWRENPANGFDIASLEAEAYGRPRRRSTDEEGTSTSNSPRHRARELRRSERSPESERRSPCPHEVAAAAVATSRRTWRNRPVALDELLCVQAPQPMSIGDFRRVPAVEKPSVSHYDYFDQMTDETSLSNREHRHAMRQHVDVGRRVLVNRRHKRTQPLLATPFGDKTTVETGSPLRPVPALVSRASVPPRVLAPLLALVEEKGVGGPGTAATADGTAVVPAGSGPKVVVARTSSHCGARRPPQTGGNVVGAATRRRNEPQKFPAGGNVLYNFGPQGVQAAASNVMLVVKKMLATGAE